MSARLRCAVYTRKSTEEGLEQSFNSLDAQRESCEAYILSQAGEGWDCLPDLYDDGGWSGGNMERPALKRLLEDIARGRIDIVVVYKVDRLTRSLMDFARIVEIFDTNNTSFVSVTQAFNTTSSMGRLTLNVLLSFAQFEREVTGERIRDKIAASKARGMWMGGIVPLGYDLEERKLIINPEEAETVRHIFTRYLTLNSIIALAKELAGEGIRSKRWTSRSGNTHGGVTLSCGALSHILNNRIYLGEITHSSRSSQSRGTSTHEARSYPGQHDPIIDPDLFNAVADRLAAHHHRKATRKTRAAACPLTSKLFDSDGQPMRPSFSYGRGKRMYRYYVSDCLLPNGQIVNTSNRTGQRLPAQRIETLIARSLTKLLPDPPPPDRLFASLARIIAHRDTLQISWDVADFVREGFCPDMALGRVQHHHDPQSRREGELIHFALPIPPTRNGRIVPSKHNHHHDTETRTVLADLVRTSHRKLAELNASPLNLELHVHMTAPTNDWTRARIAIGLLAPDIQKALLQGTAPSHITPEMLLAATLPLDWTGQRKFLGIEG
ncbi:MAG: recombinase family protein [Sphingobium sp.]